MKIDQANELERRVDEVLFYIWDPFNLKDEPFARADYRMYVSEVLNSLESNKTPEEIMNLLIDIVENRMGLKIKHEDALTISHLLLRHKNAINSGYS